MATVEIKTKLTLDDAAAKTLAKLKSGFQETGKETAKAQAGAMSFGKQFASTMLAVNFMPILHGLKSVTTGFVTLASEAYDTQQNIAGMIAGMQGIPWAEARRQAEGWEAELGDMAIAVGQSQDDINSGFKNLVTMMGGTKEAFASAKANIGNMAVIANVTGLSVDQLGQSFGSMAEGMLAKKSAVTALLKPTGIFGDDLREMTKLWQGLTEEERIARLTGAFQQLGDNLRKASPTMSDLVTSFDEIGENILEEMGMPVVKMLIPALEELKAQVADNREEIEEFAQKMGRDVGNWAVAGVKLFKEGAQLIETHAEEIKNAIVSAFEFAKGVVEFIIAHREVLALAFGAKLAAPIVSSAISAGSSIAQLGSAGTTVGGVAMAGAAGGAIALGAFTLALGGAALAVDQFQKLLAETEGGKSEDAQNFAAMAREVQRIAETKPEEEGAVSAAQTAHIERMRREMDRLALAAGSNATEVAKMFDVVNKAQADAVQVRRSAEMGVESIKGVGEADARMKELAAMVEMTTSKLATPEMLESMQMARQSMFESQEGFTMAFMGAINSQNTGSQQFMANLLARSTGLQAAFLESSTLTGDAFLTLAQLVGDQAKGFRDKLVQRGEDLISTDPKKKPPVPTSAITMNGGQVFKITQDLRDQDPDRIAFVFRRDIAREAENQTQSTGGSLFSG